MNQPDPPSPLPPVHARHVLAAIHEINRCGRLVVERLERTQPDLAEHVLESLSRVQRDLLDLAPPHPVHRRVRAVYEEVEELVLVCIRAMEIRDAEHRDPGWGASALNLGDKCSTRFERPREVPAAERPHAALGSSGSASSNPG